MCVVLITTTTTTPAFNLFEIQFVPIIKYIIKTVRINSLTQNIFNIIKNDLQVNVYVFSQCVEICAKKIVNTKYGTME